MTVLCENIFNIMVISQVSLFNYWRIFQMLLFYIEGRGEVIKKYGFLPSKPQLISSSSDSDSSCSESEHGSMLFIWVYFIIPLKIFI